MAARNAGAGIVVTMPTIGHVSADKSSTDKQDVNVTPNYINVRFHQSLPRKGAAFTLTPDTTDHFVYQDEYINFLDKTYPGAFAATTNPIMIDLDNEVDLWAYTHARLRGDATSPVTSQAGTKISYAEIVQLSVDYASAAKDVNPAVQILGPVNYGWGGYVRSSGCARCRAVATSSASICSRWRPREPPPATACSTCSTCTGIRRRAAHARPQAARCRITDNNNEAGSGRSAHAAPRSLWDSTYTREQLDHAVAGQPGDQPAAATQGQDHR